MPVGHQSVHKCAALPADWGTTFHEFAVEHTEDYLAFVVDGKTMVNTTTAEKTEFSDLPFFLILNTAVGGHGTWASAPNAETKFPTLHTIDYVRSNTRALKTDERDWSASRAQAQWFVDAHAGADSAAGTSPSTAFRTLDRVRHAVEAFRSEQTEDVGELHVVLRAGEYAPLQLGPSDGGSSADRAVVYKSWPGERAVISGGFRVPPSAVHVVPHPKGGEKSVLHVGLTQYGFTAADFGALSRDCPEWKPSSGHTKKQAGLKMAAHIHYGANSKALPLARYPNPWTNGTWQWMNVLSPTDYDPVKCKHPGRTPKSCAAGGCCASRQDFVAQASDAARVARWADEQDPWLHGYFQYDWFDTIARVASIENGTVHIDNSTPTYGTKPIQPGARWLGLNLLSELDDDVSGEYYLDRKSGDLFFIPPKGASATNGVSWGLVVSVNASCVNSSASNVRFENLDIKYAQGTGMMLTGDNISVVGCTISNHGALGLSIVGNGNTVEDCHLHDVGCAAIGVHSGSRDASLIAGNSQIIGNTIRTNSLWKRMYQPGISFDCVGCRFAGNTMFDAPHSGMLGHANDCVFDSNNFTQLCTESGDAGAWYSGRSWADRGNSIVNNYFTRIRNYGAPIPLQAQNVHAIHFDDQMSGYLVQNNTITDTWAGIKLGGGRRTIIVENSFSRVHNAIEFDNRGQTWQKAYCDPTQAKTFPHSFFKELALDKVDQPPWSAKYPYLQHIAQDHPCVPAFNNISSNTYCECGQWISATPAQISTWLSVATDNVNQTTCLKTDDSWSPKPAVVTTLPQPQPPLPLAAAQLPPPSPRFNHSWATMPVFWFSANVSGPENPQMEALIAKYPVAILAWQMGTQQAPVFRHGEDKLHKQAAALATSAPNTEVLIYVQGQLAIDWYESTRAMLPPPCGADATGVFKDFWLMNDTGKPAEWPSPHCCGLPCPANRLSPAAAGDLSYDFSQQRVRDYFVSHVALPMASAPNVKGVWFDDSDYLSCNNMCLDAGFLKLSPCDMAAKERLFNGTVDWKKNVAKQLNSRGQVPIFSSVNKWNGTASQGSCPRNERQVTEELAGLKYGRFYEGWVPDCAAIAQAQAEAIAGIAVFIDDFLASWAEPTLNQYTIAAFLVSAGNQSFFATQSSWTDPGTVWHPEYFDQPLGEPRGAAVVSGTTWHREFEHVTVDLDCKSRSATLKGWTFPPPPPPPLPPPPPPPQPPAPAKGQWGAPWYCISCSGTPGALLRDMGRNVSLPACQVACVANAKCTYINFGFNSAGIVAEEACQLYSSCKGWGVPTCDPAKHGWWTTFQYGRV
jgi:hypothetical protein